MIFKEEDEDGRAWRQQLINDAARGQVWPKQVKRYRGENFVI